MIKRIKNTKELARQTISKNLKCKTPLKDSDYHKLVIEIAKYLGLIND